MSKDFWNWVASRRAHDNPRGDFIRDTRDRLADGNDPDKPLACADSVALGEYDRLHKQWELMHAGARPD